MHPIPLTDLRRQHEECWPEWIAVQQTLLERSAWILGPELSAFEAEFARATGAPHAVGVATGTAALQIALRMRGVTSADHHVLTSPLTAPFTATAIRAAGGTPAFADIDPETLLLDPDRAEAALTPNTAAIVPVHLYGQTLDLDRWGALSRRRDMPLIQDACQAHGAAENGRPLTSYSPLAAYSFYPTKNLGALGDGGALCCESEEDLALARQLRDGGRVSGQVSEIAAWNERLDELHAAFLRIALTRLTAWNAARAALAGIYDEELTALPSELIRPVSRRPGAGHVYHLYVARAHRRDELRDFLTRQGVGTGIHYPVPLYQQPAFRSASPDPEAFPVTAQAVREIVSLPIGPHHSQDDIRHVVRLIRDFYGLARS